MCEITEDSQNWSSVSDSILL